uniref:Uncharacterized protein n=1 Tax=Knipowitschia caucasica TaxID=637954 RepID=A0AAV2LES3_KNICA
MAVWVDWCWGGSKGGFTIKARGPTAHLFAASLCLPTIDQANSKRRRRRNSTERSEVTGGGSGVGDVLRHLWDVPGQRGSRFSSCPLTPALQQETACLSPLCFRFGGGLVERTGAEQKTRLSTFVATLSTFSFPDHKLSPLHKTTA